MKISSAESAIASLVKCAERTLVSGVGVMTVCEATITATRKMNTARRIGHGSRREVSKKLVLCGNAGLVGGTRVDEITSDMFKDLRFYECTIHRRGLLRALGLVLSTSLLFDVSLFVPRSISEPVFFL